MNVLRSRGIMLILSSPSGAGKSTIARTLVSENDNTRLSISATTRLPRPGEVDGEDYHFFSMEKFDSLISQNAFIEHATVFGNRYGTLVSEVEPYLARGKNVIFDVDWQGAQKLRNSTTANVISIYIMPPSLGALKKRLSERRQDSEDVISRRMQEAMDEISHYNEYDYVVVNDLLPDSIASVKAILRAECLKLSRLDLLGDFVESL
jgi:guanylate kinase